MNETPSMADRIAQMKTDMRAIGQMQKHFLALCQQITTIVETAMAEDWEDRYLAEGTTELERFANQEENAPR